MMDIWAPGRTQYFSWEITLKDKQTGEESELLISCDKHNPTFRSAVSSAYKRTEAKYDVVQGRLVNLPGI